MYMRYNNFIPNIAIIPGFLFLSVFFLTCVSFVSSLFTYKYYIYIYIFNLIICVIRVYTILFLFFFFEYSLLKDVRVYIYLLVKVSHYYVSFFSFLSRNTHSRMHSTSLASPFFLNHVSCVCVSVK